MNIVKETIGNDISKDFIVCCYGRLYENQSIEISKSKKFANTKKGHKELLSWAHSQATGKPFFIMEATGVYYENLAYFLAEQGHNVAVVLPNKAKSYMKTLDIKSKTDSVDAAALTQFGLERQLRAWDIKPEIMRSLKALCREYQLIKKNKTRATNQLHALENSHKPIKDVIKILKEQIALCDKQIKKLEHLIRKIVDQDDDLKTKINNIDKVEGLGFTTIVTIVAETNGFALFENHKQLTSYAGLDIIHNESGLKKGKTSISKKGNKFIRASLYFPAMSAARFNPALKELYLRLLKTKNIKKVAIVAVARKLLCLIFTLWKNNMEYIPNYKRTLA